MLMREDEGTGFSESYANGYEAGCREGARDLRDRAATLRTEAKP